MKPSVRYLGAALLVGTVGFSAPLFASTAANTTITNTVTVNFDDTSGNAQTAVTASVSFTVNLVPSAPLVTVPADINPATESTSYNLVYTLTGTANGLDTYDITNNSVDTNMDGAPTFGGAASIALGGTTVAATVTAGDTDILVPYDGTNDGIVNGIAVGDTIVIDPTGTAELVTVTAIDESTGAATNTVTITVDSDPGTAGDQGTLNGFAVALIIGEQATATVTITTDTVTAGFTTGTHVTTTTFTSQTDPGATVDGAGVTVTVSRASLNVTKYVRNVTTAANNPGAADISINVGAVSTDYYLTGVSAEPGSADGSTPGDTLEYLVVVENPAGFAQADNIIVSDPVPGFTTFVTGSIQLDPIAADAFVNPSEGAADGDAAELNANTVYVYAGTGGDDSAGTDGPDGSGTGGSLTGGQTSYVLFRVTLD